MTTLNFMLVTVVAGTGSILHAMDAAGHWRLGFLSIPATLGIQKNTSGAVIGLSYRSHFSHGQGYIDLTPGGTYTGVLDAPLSGNLPISPAGVGSSSSGNVFYFNENGDFAAGVYSDGPGWLDLECMVRAPGSVPPPSVLQGHWNMVSIDTAYGLDVSLEPGGTGIVTDVSPLNHFGIFTGHADFDAAGGYSGDFDGPFSGAASIGTQGAVTSPGFGGGEVFRLNASHDTMITFHDEGAAGGYRYFIGMVKAPASLTTQELQGALAHDFDQHP